jgi:ubiquinone/menaquinone biosynthesis C-methylase UbiE
MKEYLILCIIEIQKWTQTVFEGLTGFRRTQEHVLSEYNRGWSKNLDKMRTRGVRMSSINGLWRRVSQIDLNKRFITLQHKYISKHLGGDDKNVKILEVGAGYGRIIFPMSMLFKNASFYGLEYTEAGVKTSEDFKKRYMDEIREMASSVGSITEKDPLVVEFLQGDAKSMKYPDKFFDVSYTNNVLEQIPRSEDHMRVFSEMRRVTKKFCCFLEPWREAQGPFTYFYLAMIDYFRQPTKVLYQAGFKKVHIYRMNFHHNTKYKTCVVIAEV